MFKLFLALILLLISTSAPANTLQGLRLSHHEADTRLVLDLSSDAKTSMFTLSNPDRLVIDLKQTNKAKTLLLPELNKTPIKKVRFGVRNKTTLRLVLDLKTPLSFKSHKLAATTEFPYRLVVDLYDKHYVKNTETPAIATPKSNEKPALSTNKQVLEKQAPKVTTPANKLAVEAETKPIIKVTKPTVHRDIIIAIDPGHGGKDSGALGKKGTKEKDVVLAISRRLARLVNKEPGMKAYLTRNSDIFLSLRQRIKRARDKKADMFISIHADAFNNPKARGASVFVLSERGASSEAAKLLAQKENAADLVGGISLDDKDDLLASVLLDLSQTASLEASLEVGNTVLSGLKRVGHVHKKQVESAAFVVLKSPDIPSILVETAFISNPGEERKLLSASHQNKLATAIMSGIRNYFQKNPINDSGQPQQHIVSRGDTLSMIAQRYRVPLKQLKLKNNLKKDQVNIGQVLLIP